MHYPYPKCADCVPNLGEVGKGLSPTQHRKLHRNTLRVALIPGSRVPFTIG